MLPVIPGVCGQCHASGLPNESKTDSKLGECTWMVFVGIVPATVVGRNQMTFLDNWGTSGMAGTGMSDHGQQCTR